MITMYMSIPSRADPEYLHTQHFLIRKPCFPGAHQNISPCGRSSLVVGHVGHVGKAMKGQAMGGQAMCWLVITSFGGSTSIYQY